MSRTAQKLISASGGKAYEIEQSLMFSRADGSYLIRDDGDITDGNKRTFTFATWFKKVQVGTNDILFNVRNAGGNELFMIYIPGSEQTMWIFQKRASDGNTIWYLEPTQKLRDVGAWYHFVIAVDTTQSTAADRVKLYINGTQVTSFTGSSSYPDQNLDTPCNNDSFDHQIGYNNAAGLDGYMAETYLIDGTAQAASAFGETDAVTGQWIPKKYTGSYGNNGFYLKYASGALGTDSSGQGNNYTANNLANADSMPDTPTNNFCTLNFLRNDITLTQGSLQAGGTYTSTTNKVYSTFGLISGKWWVQVHQSAANVYEANGVVNISQSAENFAVNSSTNNVSVMNWGTDVLTNGSQTQTGLTAIGGSNVLGIALDLDNGTVQFYINGSTIGSATSLTRNTGDVFVFCQAAQTSGYSGNILEQWNFGQNGTHCGQKTAGGNADGNGIGDFLNAPPSGFLAPCSANLATPAVKKSTEHFNTILYTGNDTDDRTLTGVGHQPDLVWIKPRNTSSNNHNLFDAVRGVSKRLFSNSNSAEYSDSDPNNSLVAFTSDGFTVDDSSGYSDINASDHTYVAWNWKAGGSTSTNEDGSANSTVSVNTTAGFSIADCVGTGGSATYGHGLGTTPQVVLMKGRDGGTSNWYFFTSAIDGSVDYLFLNTTAAKADSGTTINSSIFTTSWSSGVKFIVYSFAEVEGFSKIGTYIGNASVNGPYVYTGFRPAFILFKDVNATESWNLFDNKRNPYNLGQNFMWADLYSGDYVSGSNGLDLLSNGFKIRANNGVVNGSTNTWIYMAFAEAPFKYANAR